MLGHAERLALRWRLRRLGQRRGDAELGRIERQGAAAHREGRDHQQARACCRTNHESPGEKLGRVNQSGLTRPKATATYIPRGALSLMCAPRPMIPPVVPPPKFSESYARWKPSMPSPTLAPSVQPM